MKGRKTRTTAPAFGRHPVAHVWVWCRFPKCHCRQILAWLEGFLQVELGQLSTLNNGPSAPSRIPHFSSIARIFHIAFVSCPWCPPYLKISFNFPRSRPWDKNVCTSDLWRKSSRETNKRAERVKEEKNPSTSAVSEVSVSEVTCRVASA